MMAVSISFDDMLAGMAEETAVEFQSQAAIDNLFEFDTFDIIQADNEVSKKPSKSSPFHESDSGMSEDFGSIASPRSVESVNTDASEKMLDELVDSLDFEPFCQSSDKDLADYFGCESPVDLPYNQPSPSSEDQNEEDNSMSCDTPPSSPEVVRKSRKSGKRVKKIAKSQGKTVPAQVHPEPAARPADGIEDNVPSLGSSGVKSVKVLKVIRTSGTADTATEVLNALEDRNRKNAVQAKINREKKKQYIHSLEEKVSHLESRNQELNVENGSMRKKVDSLEEEVQYLRSVLANESGLAKVLSNIQNVQNVRLRSTFASRKRSTALDHDYVPSKRCKNVQSTAGVCLHVDNDTVSLEFCSKCSQMAKSSDED